MDESGFVVDPGAASGVVRQAAGDKLDKQISGLLTGLVDLFFGGPTVMNMLLNVLGILACFSWYKSDKQRKKNVAFLEKLNEELILRGHKF